MSESEHSHKSREKTPSSSQSFLTSSISGEEDNKSSPKKSQKSQKDTKIEISNVKAKTVKEKHQSQSLPSQTPPPKLSTDFQKQQEGDDIASPEEDGAPVKKVSKKIPKLSLKRQMTQRRISVSPNLVANNFNRGSRSSSTSDFQNVTSPQFKSKLGRNSLQEIKETVESKNKRQSTQVNHTKGSIQPPSSKSKPSFVGVAIEEQNSELESGTDEEGKEEEDEKVEEFAEEDDLLKKYQNDDKFKKVYDIAEKITSTIHSDQDIQDIVNYLSALPGLKGKFDHLNKNLKNKLMDCLEIRFYTMGEYLFKQGDKADYAYVVLFGQVIFLSLKRSTFISGQEPQSPAETKEQKKENAEKLIKKEQEQQQTQQINFEKRKNKYQLDNYVIIEEEAKVAECPSGFMIGEIAMMDPQKATRSLSGMAKTDCVFLLLNKDAFDILVKEKLKKEREQLCQFVFDSVPKLKDHFQFKKVQKNVHLLFPKEQYNRNKELLKEGGRSDRLYIIKEGQCVMYKKVEGKDMLGMPKMKQEKIMTIEVGAIFGEDSLFFDRDNQYSIKAISQVTCLVIKYEDLKREFKRLLPSLQNFFEKRNQFIMDRYQHIKNARNYERKHLNSKIEKGSMNVFLQKDFKNQVNFADNKTKRKLQIFFIRKELEQLQDAKQRLASEMEKEKQDGNHFNSLSHTKSYATIPKMYETPSEQYVKKVISPQRMSKNEHGQILNDKNRALFAQGQFENLRQSVLSTNQPSTKNLNILHVNQGSLAGFEGSKTFFNKGGLLKDKRTQSQASLSNLTKILNHSAMKSLEREEDQYQLKSGNSLMQTPSNRFSNDNSSARFFDRRHVKGTIVQFK